MKPYIARDTKQPLVVMGHYRVAADGGILRDPVKHEPLPTATDKDRKLLAEHGMDGLRRMQLWGVVDRLSRDCGREL